MTDAYRHAAVGAVVGITLTALLGLHAIGTLIVRALGNDPEEG